jgi:transposase
MSRWRCCGRINIEANPEAYQYSRFCELYRSWETKLSLTMRQTTWVATNCSSITQATPVSVIIDRLTGEVRQA